MSLASHIRLAAALLVSAVSLAIVPPASAAEATPAVQVSTPPWRVAQVANQGLADAQSQLILGTRGPAVREVGSARAAYAGLAPSIRRADRQAAVAAAGALASAERAARSGDRLALAAARGTLRSAIFRGAYVLTLAAVRRGEAVEARRWMLIREFRTATRYTRPGADGTLAISRLAAGTMKPAAAAQAVQKDLLDAYQGRLRELLSDAGRGQERNLPERRAEASAQAAGYFPILAPRYRQDRGAAATEKAALAYIALSESAARADASGFAAALKASRDALDGFTAAPLSPAEAARRAQQLLQFVALVPTEYGRGVKGTRVNKDFEIEEAVAFQKGAIAAQADLATALAKRNPAAAARADAALESLGDLVDGATAHPDEVAEAGEISDAAERATKNFEASMPEAWKHETDESDYDLIALTLDRLQAAAGAGQYRQAEQARLEAYAFFEFGPERRLKAFDPGLALSVEGLIWFGDSGTPGLATLIAGRKPLRDIRETRRKLDTKLGDAAATLGDSRSRATVVTNSAILVFREGLEAVLILAAITASFVGVRRRMRRPVMIGAAFGLVASGITFVLAQTLLTSLDQYGEKLEAVVGIVAIAVLLLITNWFFHRVYWSGWIGKFHRRRKKLEKIDKVGFISAQVLGLALLGLTSVYREGFETVLFLQSLQLSTDTTTVLEGAGLGLTATLAVGYVTFTLQHKLPYKKMLVVTGMLLAVVLMVMVGQTVRVMQGVGWMPISPTGGEMPYSLGLWLGIYPTWETLVAQAVSVVFMVGSYFLAREMRVKGPQRKARRRGLGAPVDDALRPVDESADDGAGRPLVVAHANGRELDAVPEDFGRDAV